MEGTDELPAGEALLAVIGPLRFVGPEKLRVTQAHREAASQLRKKIAKELRRFLASEEFDPEQKNPDFDYKGALETLTREPKADEIAAKLDGDPEEGPDLLIAAGNALEYLRAGLPKRTRVTATGPKPVDPSDADTSRFARKWQVASDPLIILADLNEGALIREQVRCLEAVYPQIYSLMKAELQVALSELAGSRAKAEVSHRKSKLLDVLALGRSWDAGLAGDLQQNLSEVDETQEKPMPDVKSQAAEGSELPTRRLEKR